MDGLLPAGLALIIAALISGAELVTGSYPRTFFIVRKCGVFYAYTLFYGVIAFGVMLGLDALTAAGKIDLAGIGIDNPWIQAIVIGVMVKALLHINLFTITSGTQSTPFGIETITQLFTNWFLKEIEIHHFNRLRKITSTRANQYNDLNDVRKRAKENIPTSFSLEDRAALKNDIDKATSVLQVMEMYLEVLGKTSFDRVFPAQ